MNVNSTTAVRKGLTHPISLADAVRFWQGTKLECSAQHLGRILSGKATDYGHRAAYARLVKQLSGKITATRPERARAA